MRGRTILLSGQTDVSTSVSSGGTTNKVAKFTGAYTIGDSTITDDGTNVSASGTITAAGFQHGTGVADSTTPLAGAITVNSAYSVILANANSGAGTTTQIQLSNSGTNTATALLLRAHGTGFSTTGVFIQDGSTIANGSSLSGGLTIGTRGSHSLQFFSNDTLRLILAGDGLSLNPVTTNSVKLGEAAALFAQVAATNCLVGAAAVGTSGVNVIAMINGTVPSTSPADSTQIFSVDASAGNATLGLRTEAAVVTETVVSDRTLQVVINGTVYKFCLKV